MKKRSNAGDDRTEPPADGPSSMPPESQTENQTGGRAGMRSLDRALKVLHALAVKGHTRMRLTDIALQAGLPKATTMRILAALVEQNLAKVDDDGRSWRLGRELIYLGLSASRRNPVPRYVIDSLETLAAGSGDTSYLTVRSGDDTICVERALGPYPLQALTIEVGSRRPLGVGSGSVALLAALPADEARSVIARNAPRLTGYPRFELGTLEREVDVARERGYALTQSHLVGGVNAIGMTVRAQSGEPVAALSVAGIADHFGAERVPMLVELISQAARHVSAGLAKSGHESLF
jgi:DNA-binding IclR family transcriptional regulator